MSITRYTNGSYHRDDIIRAHAKLTRVLEALGRSQDAALEHRYRVRDDHSSKYTWRKPQTQEWYLAVTDAIETVKAASDKLQGDLDRLKSDWLD